MPFDDRSTSTPRVPQPRVTVDGGQAFRCPPGTSVLRAMIAAGRRDLPVGCRSGGCGVCRVRIDQGRYATKLMSKAQVSDTDRAAGIALACQVFPESDLELTALGPTKNSGRTPQQPRATASNPTPNSSIKGTA